MRIGAYVSFYATYYLNGHHVLRAYSKDAFVKQYEKDNTSLRIEICSNNLKDFRLRTQSGRHGGAT